MKTGTQSNVGMTYTAPTIEVISVSIERGIASSYPGGGNEPMESALFETEEDNY